MIDLHCHLLPGLDDGAPTVAESVEMARIAATSGIHTIVATPHIRDDYAFPLDAIPRRASEVRAALATHGVAVTVVEGAEVSHLKLLALSNAELRALCLGESRYLLVESPYAPATNMFEGLLADVQARGFQPVLAHPERSPSFLHEPERLDRLVASGVLCSVTAGSLAGSFGRTVRAAARKLVVAGNAHNVASDGHDSARRRPTLEASDARSGVSADHWRWLTLTVPEALLSNAPSLPAPPIRRRRTAFRRPRLSRRA
jgi:protein-tyrosine phosphatase